MRIGIAGIKPVHQFGDIAGEIINIAAHMAAQRHHCPLVTTRRATQPQIDSPRIERIERTELFGNHQR